VRLQLGSIPSIIAISPFERFVGILAGEHRRLIGLSLLRILLGIAATFYYVSDYNRREFLWGPHAYDSPYLAGHQLSGGTFSLYLFSNSQFWFELVFHAGLVVAILFTIYGGRKLTLVQAIFMWSIYNRNQDILEGGDNLARILLIFMVFSVTNAYFSPGARRRREKLESRSGTLPIVIHNLSTYLIVFQVCVVYFYAGLNKIMGTVWQQGVAPYYISRIPAFHSSGIYASLMSQPVSGTVVAYTTVFIEIAFPFAILSGRAWIRKVEILVIETMHIGIIAFMGLVCFGIIMIAADCVALRDEDFRALYRMAQRLAVAVPRPRRAVAIMDRPVLDRVS
jgi:hypothetical protein